MKKILFKILILISLSTFCNASEIKNITEGNIDAKIKIIVYESLTCSHCADFHKNVYPELKSEFIDTGLILIEFRNFPLDMAAFNASKIAHCKNDGNSEILHYLYNNQNYRIIHTPTFHQLLFPKLDRLNNHQTFLLFGCC